MSSMTSLTMIILSLLIQSGLSEDHFSFNEQVGIIEINGVISDPLPTIEEIKRFRNNEQIKAIVVRIDSPGGGAAPSQEIYREIKKTIKNKKVIASLGSVAASGGYYIASATSGIIASPSTITGSIGVIVGFTNIQELFNKIGLDPIVIKSGKYKDMGSPARKMTEDEESLFKDFVDSIHDQFITDVSEGRSLSEDKIRELADGRIFTGQDAVQTGLIDRLGNFEDAIEWAGRLGGIVGNISVVYARQKKFSFIEQLLENTKSQLTNILSGWTRLQSSGYLMQQPSG